MKITSELLRQHGACNEQRELFAQAFPDGVTPTRELCKQYATDFEWDWAADNLLTYTQGTAYNEATAPASKAYNEATAVAFKAYSEATAVAFKAYNEATAVAFADAWNLVP